MAIHSSIGRELPSLLHQAGFKSVEGTASFLSLGTPVKTREYADMHRSLIKDNVGSRMLELGVATQAELDRYYQAFDEWASAPAAFAALCSGEAVGWKE